MERDRPIDALALVGGKTPTWYTNIGFHAFIGSEKDSEVGIGAGLVLPLLAGDAYVGVDMLDDVLLGFGFRYHVQ